MHICDFGMLRVNINYLSQSQNQNNVLSLAKDFHWLGPSWWREPTDVADCCTSLLKPDSSTGDPWPSLSISISSLLISLRSSSSFWMSSTSSSRLHPSSNSPGSGVNPWRGFRRLLLVEESFIVRFRVHILASSLRCSCWVPCEHSCEAVAWDCAGQSWCLRDKVVSSVYKKVRKERMNEMESIQIRLDISPK